MSVRTGLNWLGILVMFTVLGLGALLINDPNPVYSFTGWNFVLATIWGPPAIVLVMTPMSTGEWFTRVLVVGLVYIFIATISVVPSAEYKIAALVLYLIVCSILAVVMVMRVPSTKKEAGI